MAILTIAKSSVRSSVRGRKMLARKRIVPRALIRFSALLTIGIAATTLVLALLGTVTGDHLAVAIVGVLAIAVWLAVTFFIASIVILFRCLVALCERLVAARPWRRPRMKLHAPDFSTGVTDKWLDGLF
jgi:hypothetical protein